MTDIYRRAADITIKLLQYQRPITMTIGNINVLAHLPNSNKAKELLSRAANDIRGALKTRRWTIGALSEFYPSRPGLLGMNTGRGNHIQIRLRFATDDGAFLDYTDILGTLIHEITHNEISSHGDAFEALMDSVYTEVENGGPSRFDAVSVAATAPSVVTIKFPGRGKTLRKTTGRPSLAKTQTNTTTTNNVQARARELRNAAATKRAQTNALFAGSGQKLGGV